MNVPVRRGRNDGWASSLPLRGMAPAVGGGWWTCQGLSCQESYQGVNSIPPKEA